MSTIKISSLTELVALADPVELPVAYLGVTKKVTARHFQDYVLGNLTVAGTTLGTNTSSLVIQLASDIVPTTDETYSLGSSDKRFKTLWVGTGSVYITDKTLGTNVELTMDNGVLQINGANQLQVGQLKFAGNTIESTTGATDIQIGYTTDTGNVTLNRNLVLGSSGTAITFYDGSKQLTAWNSTATVLWSQITGVPGDNDPYTTTATVNTLIANSLTNYATQIYVNSQGFITSSALTGYATQTYVNSQGFITSSALTGYATQTYVTGLGYTTTATVTALIANSLYIEQPNYVTVSSAGTYTASTLTSINILLYTAGSVNVTWTMPPNPIDGQVCKWTNASSQTSVFFISPGVTLVPAISGPYNAGTKFQYVYRSADNKWYACP
jgi:hypothetical protein